MPITDALTMEFDVEDPTLQDPSLTWVPSLDKHPTEAEIHTTSPNPLPKPADSPHTQAQDTEPLEDISADEILCRQCGWTTSMQTSSSYIPRMHLLYTKQACGLWAIGNGWLLWDRPKHRLGNDFMTWEFLRKHEFVAKNIPLVKQMIQLNDKEDTTQLTLMSRAPGSTLEDVWFHLNDNQKSQVRSQLCDFLLDLRKFTSLFPCCIDGSPLQDHIIGTCGPYTCPGKSIMYPPATWLDILAPELRSGISKQLNTQDPALIDAKLTDLKARFPAPEPYILTHADLHSHNIIVDFDPDVPGSKPTITAIIDWERAGYYPWWAESYIASSRNFAAVLDPVWEVVDPRLVSTRLDGELGSLEEIRAVWGMAEVRHKGEGLDEGGWMRRAFCRCRPLEGLVRDGDVTGERGHCVAEAGVGRSGE